MIRAGRLCRTICFSMQVGTTSAHHFNRYRYASGFRMCDGPVPTNVAAPLTLTELHEGARRTLRRIRRRPRIVAAFWEQTQLPFEPRYVAVGEAVHADENIFVLADLSSVWVEVTVYARDLAASIVCPTSSISSCFAKMFPFRATLTRAMLIMSLVRLS